MRKPFSEGSLHPSLNNLGRMLPQIRWHHKIKTKSMVVLMMAIWETVDCPPAN
jgi:hypothetical protein